MLGDNSRNQIAIKVHNMFSTISVFFALGFLVDLSAMTYCSIHFLWALMDLKLKIMAQENVETARFYDNAK